MTREDTYVTRDGERHRSFDRAEDHCLQSAHRHLFEVLKSVDCDAAYRVAQAIISSRELRLRIKQCSEWICDIELPEDSE